MCTNLANKTFGILDEMVETRDASGPEDGVWRPSISLLSYFHKVPVVDGGVCV